tara:strand:- start:66 stop:689 length:624 start_codon:yes stop_codon:yes gene_type:complete
MKIITKIRLLQRLLLLGAVILTGNQMIAQTLPDDAITQIVCIGVEDYEIVPNATSTYTWSIIDQGTGFSPLVGEADITPITSDWYIEVDFTISGTYVLSVLELDANSCEGATVDLVITVNPLPIITASSSPLSPLCENDDLTLTGAGAGVGGTYTWDNSVIDNTLFTPGVGTVPYTVTGTDGNGCEATDAISVTVNPIPTPGPIWHN